MSAMTKGEVDEAVGLLQRDLDSLFKLTFATNRPIAEGDIRLASVTLRKWLVGGLLGRLCNSLGAKATLVALDNSRVLDALPREPSITYFLTASVYLNGRSIQGLYNSTIDYPGRPLLPVEEMEQNHLTLRQFLQQRRLYFEGEFFSCEEIVKYTANKLGGVHLDWNRPGKLGALARAASFMMYGGPTIARGTDPPSELYLVLEPRSSEVLTGLHLEIIAAAASFVQVEIDGQQLIEVKSRPTLRSWLNNWLGRNYSGFLWSNYGRRSR